LFASSAPLHRVGKFFEGPPPARGGLFICGRRLAALADRRPTARSRRGERCRAERAPTRRPSGQSRPYAPIRFAVGPSFSSSFLRFRLRLSIDVGRNRRKITIPGRLSFGLGIFPCLHYNALHHLHSALFVCVVCLFAFVCLHGTDCVPGPPVSYILADKPD
jgi:hypothetical protein